MRMQEEMIMVTVVDSNLLKVQLTLIQEIIQNELSLKVNIMSCWLIRLVTEVERKFRRLIARTVAF